MNVAPVCISEGFGMPFGSYLELILELLGALEQILRNFRCEHFLFSDLEGSRV